MRNLITYSVRSIYLFTIETKMSMKKSGEIMISKSWQLFCRTFSVRLQKIIYGRIKLRSVGNFAVIFLLDTLYTY